MKLRTTMLPAIGLLATVLLAGCSGTGSSGDMSGMDHGSSPAPSDSDAAADFNDADVAFAMGMIAHHQQAIEMSDMLLEKDGVDPAVADLAQTIKDAQQPEIDTMTEWLDDWGQPVESSGMEGMDHGGMMMSEDDMAALESATGEEGSTLFLEQMIVHHEGAIDMAETEAAEGQNPDATALAEKIITDQTAEIQQMRSLLASS
ncbi:DUF305 domain-containing protein [Agromyces sp. Leaf222]|jgi:uncharacterized protein (DUF305 family)|uniref:DUF305 domain-containing protein n=1 Tax=Agromyces sp. Leaf222 TaxID=1735688 RepID=UPI0006F1D5BE|nr:DUF305 domain-containing protein [Agromyces sp. Leaf222]KQM82381.1 hypothetical protein ASE68_03030 [Agromyces sp. Leaf222]